MTSKLGSSEHYAEEYSKIEKEVKQAQLDLDDTLNLNEALSKQIAEKEKEITEKEAWFKTLQEKNAADAEQLEIEFNACKDKWKYEVERHQSELHQLEMHKTRFNETLMENEHLRESIKLLSEKLTSDREEHALAMHEMNKSMKTFRQQMEQKLRKELTTMDVSFQKEAFEALQEKQKLALFENAKLKDEVALQGVGIVNIGSRLGKQMQQYDKCLKELHESHKKSKKLRKLLGGIAVSKNILLKRKEEIDEEEASLLKQKQALLKELSNDPSRDYLEEKFANIQEHVIEEESYLRAWRLRRLLLQKLYLEVKPVSNVEETDGRYNVNTFPLKATITIPFSHAEEEFPQQEDKDVDITDPIYDQNFDEKDESTGLSIREQASSFQRSKSMRSNAMSSHSAGSMKLNELRFLLDNDSYLAAALLPIKGRENIVLTPLDEDADSESEGKDQNMIAWITLQILDIWEYSQKLADERISQKMEKLNVAREMSALANDAMKQIFPKESTSSYGISQMTQITIDDMDKKEMIKKKRKPTPIFVENSIISPFDTKTLSTVEEISKGLDSDQEILMGESINLSKDNNFNQSLMDSNTQKYLEKMANFSTVEKQDFDERVIQELWDDVFSEASKSSFTQDNSKLDIMRSTDWIKKVPNARRYPQPELHLSSPILGSFYQKTIGKPLNVDVKEDLHASCFGKVSKRLKHDLKFSPILMEKSLEIGPPMVVHNDQLNTEKEKKAAQKLNALLNPTASMRHHLPSLSEKTTKLSFETNLYASATENDPLVIKKKVSKLDIEIQKLNETCLPKSKTLTTVPSPPGSSIKASYQKDSNIRRSQEKNFKKKGVEKVSLSLSRSAPILEKVRFK